MKSKIASSKIVSRKKKTLKNLLRAYPTPYDIKKKNKGRLLSELRVRTAKTIRPAVLTGQTCFSLAAALYRPASVRRISFSFGFDILNLGGAYVRHLRLAALAGPPRLLGRAGEAALFVVLDGDAVLDADRGAVIQTVRAIQRQVAGRWRQLTQCLKNLKKKIKKKCK